jgi:hypothetical protein
MKAMDKAFATVAIAALLALAPALPIRAAGTAAASPSPAPPQTIYRIVTRPMCAELHKHIAPAVGMLLQNDETMKSSPQLFKEYNRGALSGVDNSASNSNGNAPGSVTMTGDAADGTMNPSQNMALLKMENMVSPIANNIIAMEKMLDTPSLLQKTGNPDDDKQLAAIREKLLKAIADQNATLDIINGFVQTQQMGDLQHSGQDFIAAVNQSDTSNQSVASGATPNPMLQDPNAPGLPGNPYDFQPAAIPGLTLGNNPVTRLLQAVNWTIAQTQSNENDASVAIMAAAQSCGAGAPASPPPK